MSPSSYYIFPSETYFERRRGIYVFFVSSSAPKNNHVERSVPGGLGVQVFLQIALRGDKSHNEAEGRMHLVCFSKV